ncbi:sphingosine-1-phosphate phosphatase 2 [Hydra vulgaris]|uniref:Sphingosine-1-phosphate phosphatase 2 n=1 Tax=Hydra vulgaris TaxID=6087 RepID=A0ABM4CJ69_HYDVU
MGSIDQVVWFQKYCGLARKSNINDALNLENHDNKEKKLISKTSDEDTYDYNPLVHKLFQIGSELGNEAFYITFLPFVSWNIDEYICRRLILLWVFCMYAGQGIKDILCWPRPESPPVIRLEKIYESEYGMPSTHAIAGVVIPFSLIYFSYGRFQYDLVYGILFHILWTGLVCFSRVYRGMHSFHDIVAGISVAFFVTALWLPYLDITLEMFLASSNAWIIILIIPMLMIYVFPTQCMETRNDTARIICVGCGCTLAAWNMYYIDQVPLPEPYKNAPVAMFSSGFIPWVLFGASRFIIGVAIIVPIKICLKTLIHSFFNFMNSEGSKTTDRKADHIFVIPYLFITYTLIGYSAIYVAPKAFEMVGLIL